MGFLSGGIGSILSPISVLSPTNSFSGMVSSLSKVTSTASRIANVVKSPSIAGITSIAGSAFGSINLSGITSSISRLADTASRIVNVVKNPSVAGITSLASWGLSGLDSVYRGLQTTTSVLPPKSVGIGGTVYETTTDKFGNTFLTDDALALANNRYLAALRSSTSNTAFTTGSAALPYSEVFGKSISIDGSRLGIMDKVKFPSPTTGTSIALSRNIDDDLIPAITVPGGIRIPGLGTSGLAGVLGLGQSVARAISNATTKATAVTAGATSGTTTGPMQIDGSLDSAFNLNPGNIMSQISNTVQSSGLQFAAGLASRAMGMVANMVNGKDKFQRTYNWELLLPGIGILSPEIMGRYIQEVSFGEYSIDEVTKLRYGGEQRGHAGTFSIPRMTVKFLKPVPDLVYTYLMLWKDMIVDSNGFFSAKSKYALPGYIIMFDTTGKQSGSYKVVNMFPLKFPTHSLSYAESSIVSYTVEFNVDRLETLS